MGTRGTKGMARVMPDATLGKGLGSTNNNNPNPDVITCKFPGGGGGCRDGGGLWWRGYNNGMLMAHAREVPVQIQSPCRYGGRRGDGDR